MNELVLSLIFSFLSFKEMMSCRQLTDTGTRSWDDLLPMLNLQNNLDLLNLSNKKNFSIPISLLPQIFNTKLLIY